MCESTPEKCEQCRKDVGHIFICDYSVNEGEGVYEPSEYDVIGSHPEFLKNKKFKMTIRKKGIMKIKLKLSDMVPMCFILHILQCKIDDLFTLLCKRFSCKTEKEDCGKKYGAI